MGWPCRRRSSSRSPCARSGTGCCLACGTAGAVLPGGESALGSCDQVPVNDELEGLQDSPAIIHRLVPVPVPPASGELATMSSACRRRDGRSPDRLPDIPGSFVACRHLHRGGAPWCGIGALPLDIRGLRRAPRRGCRENETVLRHPRGTTLLWQETDFGRWRAVRSRDAGRNGLAVDWTDRDLVLPRRCHEGADHDEVS